MLLRNTSGAFRHRDYLIFWSGLFLDHTGTLVQATAQAWLIFQFTDSPFYLGLEGCSFRLWAEPLWIEQIVNSYLRSLKPHFC